MSNQLRVILTAVDENTDMKCVPVCVKDFNAFLDCFTEHDNYQVSVGTDDNNKCFISITIYDDSKITSINLSMFRQLVISHLEFLEKTGNLYNLSWTYVHEL